ncbi:MAG TPA: hypothetical protein VIH38_10830, partial [Steroidobacteraceae bacterium]
MPAIRACGSENRAGHTKGRKHEHLWQTRLSHLRFLADGTGPDVLGSVGHKTGLPNFAGSTDKHADGWGR